MEGFDENKIEWKQIESDIWKPLAEGQKLVGMVSEIEEHYEYGKTYVLTTTEGKKIKTPYHKALQLLMEDNIKEYDMVKIVYKGQIKTSKGKPCELYDVYVGIGEEPEI